MLEKWQTSLPVDNNMKVHHVGYLVKRIDNAIECLGRLGYCKESEIVYDDIREIDVCFLVKDGYRIELVSPLSNSSVVFGLFKQYRNSPYHICYETDKFEADIAELCANGYTLIEEPQPAPAFEHGKVGFLMSPEIGMIEILDAAGLY